MIYLASPYSSPLQGALGLGIQKDRYLKALEFVTFTMLTKGPPVFSPIVYCHPIALANPALGTDAAYWQKFNMAFIRKCEAVFALILPGWESSKGMKVELEVAKMLDIPIVYYNDSFEEVVLQ